jgi:hypothetical protein
MSVIPTPAGGLEPPASVYQASRIKAKRVRATKLEIERRRKCLIEIIAEMHPMTVRQVFYQATVRNLVEKTEQGYGKIQTDLTLLRRDGKLSYGWIADNTRWQRKPATFNSVDHALNSVHNLYRKALWNEVEAYVEIWLEKDALAGVVLPVTSRYDVPLMVARGYASLSFLHSAAEYIGTLDVPTFIYHLGDFDPSGVNAGQKIEQTLREMAPNANITFERIAVTIEQIIDWNLPSRPTKQSDPRAKKFGSDQSVELDAIDPRQLRSLVGKAIQQHLPRHQFKQLMRIEEDERRLIGGLVGMVKDRNKPKVSVPYSEREFSRVWQRELEELAQAVERGRAK